MPRCLGPRVRRVHRAAACALLLLLAGGPAHAATLKLATWNLGWLTARAAGDPALPANVTPRTPADIDRLRVYAEALDADVVALQGVDGPEIAARVFAPGRYALHLTDDAIVQRVGFAIRRGIAFTANPDLAALDPDPQARLHLRRGADVTLHLPGGPLRLLAVDLKAGCRQESPAGTSARPACAVLRAQMAVLRGWIAARSTERAGFVLLGDFNRWMEGADPFWAGLREGGTLDRATDGQASPCWGGQHFVDHIVAGGPAGLWMRADTLRVLVYRETTEDWRHRLSDHCPVAVQFRLPDALAAEPAPAR